jgi:EAL domain-containing protein (putative c-di-GMP-specific phosphodiesterase class I)
VVAEGVETKAMLELLADMQCDYAQGYYIAKPLSADAIAQFLIHSEYQTERQSKNLDSIH